MYASALPLFSSSSYKRPPFKVGIWIYFIKIKRLLKPFRFLLHICWDILRKLTIFYHLSGIAFEILFSSNLKIKRSWTEHCTPFHNFSAELFPNLRLSVTMIPRSQFPRAAPGSRRLSVSRCAESLPLRILKCGVSISVSLIRRVGISPKKKKKKQLNKHCWNWLPSYFWLILCPWFQI